jgi:hypothetical protein
MNSFRKHSSTFASWPTHIAFHIRYNIHYIVVYTMYYIHCIVYSICICTHFSPW